MRDRIVLTALGAFAVLVFSAAPAAAQAAKPKAMSHSAEGRSNCMMCHSGAMEAVPGVPASHEGRPNEVCLWCHAPDAAIQTKEPPVVPHQLEGREQCIMCHSGKMEAVPAVPADHEGRDVKYCTLCHTTGG